MMGSRRYPRAAAILPVSLIACSVYLVCVCTARAPWYYFPVVLPRRLAQPRTYFLGSLIVCAVVLITVWHIDAAWYVFPAVVGLIIRWTVPATEEGTSLLLTTRVFGDDRLTGP